MTDSDETTRWVCFRCLVSGRVQGVFFRASTREQAERLGIRGHARNLPDGRVEVLACGAPEAVRELRAWLLRGPPRAEVTDLECAPISDQPGDPLGDQSARGFSTG